VQARRSEVEGTDEERRAVYMNCSGAELKVELGLLCRSQLGNKQQLVDRLVAATSAERSGPEPAKKKQKKPAAKKGAKKEVSEPVAEVKLLDGGNGPFAGVKGKAPQMEEEPFRLAMVMMSQKIYMVRFAVLYSGEGEDTQFLSLEMLEEHSYNGVKHHVVTHSGSLEALRTLGPTEACKSVSGKEAACKKYYNQLFAEATSDGFSVVDEWFSSIGSGRLRYFLPSGSTQLDIRVQRIVRELFAELRAKLIATKVEESKFLRNFAGVHPTFEFPADGSLPEGLSFEMVDQLMEAAKGMLEASGLSTEEGQAEMKKHNERFLELLPHETPLEPSQDPRHVTGIVERNETPQFVDFCRYLKAALVLIERSPGVFYNDDVDQMYKSLHYEITPLSFDEEEGEEAKKMFARRLRHTDLETPLPKAGNIPFAFFEAYKLRCSRVEAEFDGSKGNKHLLFAQGVTIPQLVNNDNGKWRCDSQAAGHKDFLLGTYSTVAWEVALGDLKDAKEKEEEDFDSTVSYFSYECENPAYRKPRYLFRFAFYTR